MDKDFLSVVQLTDTHLFTERDATLYGVQTDRALTDVLDAMKSSDEPPDLVLVTGDLVHDETEKGYERLRAYLSGLGAPVYILAGNHDDLEIMSRLYADGSVLKRRSVTHGKWHFIFFDTHQAGAVGGHLTQDQYTYLQRSLRGHPNSNILIALHHHPVPIGSRWLDRIGLDQPEKFLSEIGSKQQIKAVIWGHIHQEWDEYIDHIRFMGAPSTCFQFAPKRDGFALDPSSPGWRRLKLYNDGRIDSWIERLPTQA